MKLINYGNGVANINISLGELIIINNSLNEICNGIDLSDFETRMGATKDETLSLLESVGKTIDESEMES